MRAHRRLQARNVDRWPTLAILLAAGCLHVRHEVQSFVAPSSASLDGHKERKKHESGVGESSREERPREGGGWRGEGGDQGWESRGQVGPGRRQRNKKIKKHIEINRAKKKQQIDEYQKKKRKKWKNKRTNKMRNKNKWKGNQKMKNIFNIMLKFTEMKRRRRNQKQIEKKKQQNK